MCNTRTQRTLSTGSRFTSVNSNVTDKYPASVLIGDLSPWQHLTTCSYRLAVNSKMGQKNTVMHIRSSTKTDTPNPSKPHNPSSWTISLHMWRLSSQRSCSPQAAMKFARVQPAMVRCTLAPNLINTEFTMSTSSEISTCHRWPLTGCNITKDAEIACPGSHRSQQMQKHRCGLGAGEHCE